MADWGIGRARSNAGHPPLTQRVALGSTSDQEHWEQNMVQQFAQEGEQGEHLFEGGEGLQEST